MTDNGLGRALVDRRQIRSFLAVGEHLQLTRAAHAIGLSQPGVSYQLASIEALMGAPLINRTGKQLALTLAGDFLYRELRRLCLDYALALADCRAASGAEPPGHRLEEDALPDFRRLRCFLATARRLNFTKAAQDMCLTQSALSYQITQLEVAVGQALFLRSSRVVEMTGLGLRLFRYVETFMQDYEALVRRCQGLRDQVEGSLVLGYVGGVEMQFLPRLLHDFSKGHPAVQVTTRYLTLAHLFDAILLGEIDCGFTLLFDHRHPDGLAVYSLAREQMVAVVHREHPFARRQSLRLEELRGHPLVSLCEDMGRPGVVWHREVCARVGIDFDRAEFLPDFQSLWLALEMGRGIGIQPRATCEQHGGGHLRYIPLEDPDLSFEYALAWPTKGANPCVDVLLGMLPLPGAAFLPVSGAPLAKSGSERRSAG